MGGGNSSLAADERRFVIIGGGYAGSAVGMGLKRAGAKNFTVINNREHFHHNIASVRAICLEDWPKKTMIPLKESFGDHFKLGKVVSIKPEEKKVVLEKDNEEIEYDVLVIATGTTGPFPNKLHDDPEEEYFERWKNMHEKLKKEETKNVVILGGGATGVEQACEIKSYFPEKNVTIVHSSHDIVSKSVNENFKNKAKAVLDRLGVRLLLGQKVEDLEGVSENMTEPVTLKTTAGESVEADMVLLCVGLRTNAEAYKNTFAELIEEGSNRLMVDEFLQVKGHNDIYAIGDCCNTDETKLGFTANAQGNHLINNWKNELAKKEKAPWKPNSLPISMVLAMGPTAGLAQTKGGSVLPEFVVKQLKCKDLGASRTWKGMEQSMPK